MKIYVSRISKHAIDRYRERVTFEDRRSIEYMIAVEVETGIPLYTGPNKNGNPASRVTTVSYQGVTYVVDTTIPHQSEVITLYTDLVKGA